MSKDWQVGDQLAVSSGFTFKHQTMYHIYTIDRISPSGRISLGNYILNPDLSIRGADIGGPQQAVPVTEEMVDVDARERLISRIAHMATACRGGLRELETEKLTEIYTLMSTPTIPKT